VDVGDFAGRECAVLRDHLREGGPAQVFHPEADLAVDAGGTENADDVRVTEAGEQAALLHDLVGVRVRIGRAAEKLERDLAIELRIPRAVDVAEGAACDVIENVEVPPASGRPWSCG